ncbi:hypothetical protein SSCHL_2008 [Staphylococcus schleiferi]|uniref:hypothetical protein n=1 Tax=Staphylococcus coagulans TaxID=74706 RepID=UPI0006BD119A|nr:hypothetical protein [Staphylococcus coagulans]PNZ12919.1 hypothetical protein CD118_00925 [Staphylococcus coagulans]BAS46788.1 hypothetical protein SSCHL_2008 [Staphylococcus schleiferi]
MALFVILNIIIVIGTLLVDLHRHHYRYIRLSSVILSLTLSSFVNPILLNKLNFITLATMLMYLTWLILQYHLDYTHHTFKIRHQKFFIGVLTIMISILFVILARTSEVSIYMSVPYLAPAIFLFGGILQFSTTLNSPCFSKFYQVLKIKHPIWMGGTLILLSMITMVSLTPFWYLFVIVYVGFWATLTIEKIFILPKND